MKKRMMAILMVLLMVLTPLTATAARLPDPEPIGTLAYGQVGYINANGTMVRKRDMWPLTDNNNVEIVLNYGHRIVDRGDYGFYKKVHFYYSGRSYEGYVHLSLCTWTNNHQYSVGESY